jgi:tetratricopeptide (TPR) repeat protein
MVLVGVMAVLAGPKLARSWRSFSLPKQKLVVVLPFRSIGGDAGQQAFCDGLTETVTTALSKHGELSVVPATESRRIGSAQAARKQFGVNLVVSGTVQRRGEQVRVVLTLSDAERDRQIDAEPIDWPVAKLFDIEDAVLQKLADLLNLAFAEPHQDRPAATASHNPSAYDSYLRGRGFLYHYDRPGNLDRALQEFEDAAQFDPQFALAYVGQAETQLRMYRLRKGDSDLLQRAHTAAEKARGLNPELAAAHVVLGGILTDLGKPDDAIRELETALQRDPRDPALYTELGRLYGRLGRHAEAENLYRKAIAQRPGDWRTYRAAATYYSSVQQFAEAERYSRKVLDLAPDNSEGYMNLGALLLKLGRRKEAERMLLKAQDLNATASGYANLAYLYMAQHRFAEAVVVMEKSAAIAEQQQSGEFRIWGNLGDAYWLARAAPEKARQAWSRAATIVRDLLGAAPTQDSELLSYLAKFEAKAGDSDLASRHLDTALAHGEGNANTQYQAALAYAVLGRSDDSLHALAAAIQLKYPVDEIQQAPELEILWRDPRYLRLFPQPPAKR